MQYRPFGKIGSVSSLGFGCMRLPTGEDGHIDESLAIPLLRRGYALGINYFDTAYYYCNEESQYVVGRAVKPFRDQILLSRSSRSATLRIVYSSGKRWKSSFAVWIRPTSTSIISMR